MHGRLYAAPAARPRLLVVFLRGGYDACNLLVPYSSSFYYEMRPNIAIAAPLRQSTTGALALNADWALHPAVRDRSESLYARGRRRLCRLRVPMTCRAAISRPRTASSSASR
jgi:uncharacterized protein (DUF1501 family)